MVKPVVMIIAIAAFSAGQAEAFANEAPKRDARGIAVVSSPATAPAGFNGQSAQTGASARACITCGGTGGTTTSVPTGNGGPGAQNLAVGYPSCTRTVTDGCVQAYERRASLRR